MLIRLQFCDMVPNEQESTSITSACQISPHSPACSPTTPSKAFFKLQAAGDSQASHNHKKHICKHKCIKSNEMITVSLCHLMLVI